MRKSTRFLLVFSLLPFFAALSLSALADDHKKAATKAPAVQPSGHTAKIGTSGSSKGKTNEVGAPTDLVNGAVNSAVGGDVSGAVGGLLKAFGPK